MEALSALKEKIPSKIETPQPPSGTKKDKQEVKAPAELKGLLVRSEMENVFEKKKVALELFKEKMNWKMPDRAKAEFTDLYPDDVLRAARDGDIKKTFELTTSRPHEENIDSKSYFKNIKINHERNIDEEKCRRLALRTKKLEGIYRGSAINFSSPKQSVDRITFHSEKPTKRNLNSANRKFTLTFRGSRLKTDLDDFIERDNLQQSFNISRRARTATNGWPSKPHFLINDSNSKTGIIESQKEVSLGYVTDGFKKPSQLRPRGPALTKISPFSARRGGRPMSGLTVNNVVLRPSAPDDNEFGIPHQGFRFTSTSLRMRSTSKGSIEMSRNQYSSSQLHLDENTRHKNTNLIAQKIYSFCQTKSKDKAKSRLLNGLLSQSSKLPLH
jgi:hypothetical protein